MIATAGILNPMSRYLVCSAHTGREPPACYIIDAASADEIEQRYPLFAGQPVYRLPHERPDWLSDDYLTFVEAYHLHRLGDEEPRWLTTLVEHHARGDVWQWYSLEERSANGEPVYRGELGTWRRFQVGSDVGGLPRHPGRWRVVAIKPAPHPDVAAELVIEKVLDVG